MGVAGEDGAAPMDGSVGEGVGCQGDRRCLASWVRCRFSIRSNRCGCPMGDPYPGEKVDHRLHWIPFQNLLVN